MHEISSVKRMPKFAVINLPSPYHVIGGEGTVIGIVAVVDRQKSAEGAAHGRRHDVASEIIVAIIGRLVDTGAGGEASALGEKPGFGRCRKALDSVPVSVADVLRRSEDAAEGFCHSILGVASAGVKIPCLEGLCRTKKKKKGGELSPNPHTDISA